MDYAKYKTAGRRFAAALVDGIAFLLFDVLLYKMLGDRLNVASIAVISGIARITYSVSMHAYHGQTLGKMITGVYVANVSEQAGITLKQALLRDGVWIALFLLQLPFLLNPYLFREYYTGAILQVLESAVWIWLILELLTMYTNRKRRSVHDFIARTVVIKVT